MELQEFYLRSLKISVPTLRTINLVHNKFGYNNFGYDNFSHKFRNHLVYNNFSQIFDFSRPLLLLFSWFILQVLAIFFKLYSPNSYFFFLVEQFTRALLSFDNSSEENVGASVLLTRSPLELKKHYVCRSSYWKSKQTCTTQLHNRDKKVKSNQKERERIRTECYSCF